MSDAGSWGIPAGVQRTPDERFARIGAPELEPRTLEVPVPGYDGGLRLAYADAGPVEGRCLLLLHDQATWSYLFRDVIRIATAAGLRVVAPDLLGFGRSDKPDDRLAYDIDTHVRMVRTLLHAIDAGPVTLVGIGMGARIGLAVLVEERARFDGAVVSGTELRPAAGGDHGADVHVAGLADASRLAALAAAQRDPDWGAASALTGMTARPLPAEVVAAYEAPYPDERFRQGLRQMSVLATLSDGDPAATADAELSERLGTVDLPLLTLTGALDPRPSGDMLLRDRVPGAAGQPHAQLDGVGRLWPEDAGTAVAEAIVTWVRHGDTAVTLARLSGAEHRPAASPRAAHAGPARQGTLTWAALRERAELHLYVGDIPFDRARRHGDDELLARYGRLVGLSLDRQDAHHVLHDVEQPLPLPDDRVASYQSEEAFHYIPFERLPAVFDEAHRVLRPGGLFRLSLPDYGSDVLRRRSLYSVDGEIVFDPGAGGTPFVPGNAWFPRIDRVRELLGRTRFATAGTITELHFVEMDGRPVTRPIDHSLGHVFRTPDHDRRVMDPYRPLSIVVDLRKAGLDAG